MNKKTIYKYKDLDKDRQSQAVQHFVGQLLEAIHEGLRFNDASNHDDLQARIDKAIEDAESMHTPWFTPEYILATCKADLEGMALCDAEDATYSVSADGKHLYLVETVKTEIK